MKSAILVLAVLLVAALAAAPAPSQAVVEQQWQSFLTRYNRSYDSRQEFSMRRDVFRRNLIRAAEMNAAAEGKTQYGVTKFFDLTPEEFKMQYLMANAPEIDYELLKAHHKEYDFGDMDVPQDHSWIGSGLITPVYNQGQCGSCWAFSATEQIETMWMKKHNQLHRLSMQQIVDCDHQAYGCGGGWTYSAYEYIMSAPGQDSYQSYPYTAQNGYCQFKTSSVIANIASWEYITQDADETKMRNYIGSTAPLSICADASSWQYYQGGVLMGNNCGSQIDHCIQLVGYKMSASTPYWIVRNSWGPDWGENGYIYLQYGQNTCAMGNVVTTVAAAAQA